MANKRLYQVLGEKIRTLILQGEYPIGTKLPPERLIGEQFDVSRTVVREAIIMLELEGYVEVRKGSGIHVIKQDSQSHPESGDELEQFVRYVVHELKGAGPFEMLQARQLIECSIAGFAASQVTKSDISELKEIHQKSTQDSDKRDSEWDRKFHHKLAEITNNSVLAVLVELMWFGRENNPLWLKLHEHVEEESLNAWENEHDEIITSLLRKDPIAAKKAQWRHIESTKQALYNASSVEDNPYDKYLFQEDPTQFN